MVMGRQVATVGAIACMLAIGGCADSLEPRRPDGPGVTGRAILVDDTGRPPLADGGGEIVVIPETALTGLWRRIGPGEPDDLAHIGFTLDPDMVADLGGEIMPVDDDGHFRLTHTGPQLICRLPDSSASPAFVRGCDRVDLPVSGAVTVSFGEGGFRVETTKP
jgi:hypothetical protein